VVVVLVATEPVVPSVASKYLPKHSNRLGKSNKLKVKNLQKDKTHHLMSIYYDLKANLY
jgi:hypothetical protein